MRLLGRSRLLSFEDAARLCNEKANIGPNGITDLDAFISKISACLPKMSR